DVIFPSHRDLGAFLVKGMTPFTVLAQYLGRVDGPTRGRDGNLHMGQWDLGIGGFISHMADTVPVAAGVALSFRYRSRSSVVLCYNGDGATSRGDWHEGINLAAVEKLPVVYICVNNGFAYSTPTARQMAVDRVATRAGGYGIPGRTVDGNDVLAVHVAAREAIDRARAGDGPTLLECRTYRMTGHSAHDPADYVPAAFWEEGRRMDPIDRYQAWLVAEGLIGESGIERLEADIVREVEEAAERALASPEPAAEDVLEGVYAGPSAPPGAGAGRSPHTRLEPTSAAT
ncbi:MAG TPA: thiamine pyrophosphate-dependent dehydrogenase E1 component subunit alpha, partial [Longimicrobiales bacterium]|nr:thiamine pyrophosphate-dependent dehydrogenase E1 component subunit alpha [Longimicrobiales bacterium]